MSEKVSFVKIVDTGKKYQDKPIIEIETKDGRKGSAFDTLFLGLSMETEYEVDIRPAKDYNDEKRYYFNMPKSGDQKKQGFTKDWTFDKRKASLECAIELGKIHPDKASTDIILQVAEKLYEYLNKK